MSRVVGVGGIFLKAKDPDALRSWYRDHLGMEVESWGGMSFSWNRPDGPGTDGATIWSVMPETTKYFDPSPARFMVNFIVPDLDSLLATLRAEGCEVDAKTEESEFGKFGWVMDPEGHRIELWEPPKATLG